MKTQSRFVGFAITAWMVAACEPELAPGVADVDWRLMSIKAPGLTIDSITSTTPPTARFGIDASDASKGSIWGTSGCNSYRAEYTLHERRELAVTQLVTTLAGCEVSKGALEAAYYESLRRALQYWASPTRLVIQTDRDGILLFRAQ